MYRCLLLLLLLVSSISLVFAADSQDFLVVVIGVVMFVIIILVGVVIFYIRRGRKKKKGISRKSANFAKLVKYYCRDSGIPVNLQLQATKIIARDYVDAQGKDLSQFFFMTPDQARLYLRYAGLNDLDADIFYSILNMNKSEFIAI